MGKSNGVKNKFRFSTSSLLNFTKDSYLERTSRPFYAAVFLLPFIIFYEIGTILLNTDLLRQSQVRVVAFVWLKNFLEYLGFTSKLAWTAPPLAVIIILLSLQLVSRKSWQIWFKDFLLMTAECITLAIPLIVLSLFLITSADKKTDAQKVSAAFGSNQYVKYEEKAPENKLQQDSIALKAVEHLQSNQGQNKTQNSAILAEIVTGIGAGIYEELVFRLILICILMIIFSDILKFDPNQAIILSVFISAGLFSIYHHIDFLTGRQIDEFSITKFLFRTIAGVYFAVLYAIRGFGVTAGTHAFYDILAVLINVFIARG
jgi:hypothetical protein